MDVVSFEKNLPPMNPRPLLGVFGLLTTITAMAQITLVDTHAERLEVILSLDLSGPKLIDRSDTGFVLYNTDLSPFASVIFPPPPPLFYYTSVPTYITEATFDTDPTSIEFLQPIQKTGGMVNGVRVMRMDGTILLEDTLHSAGGVNGMDEFSTSPPIFTDSTGTYMLLSVINGPSALYALPGSLPCLACDPGSLVTGGDGHLNSAATANMTIFPNPAHSMISIAFQLPAGTHHAQFMLINTQGQCLRSAPVDRSGRMEFDVSDLAAATYLCRLSLETGEVLVERLVTLR